MLACYGKASLVLNQLSSCFKFPRDTLATPPPSVKPVLYDKTSMASKRCLDSLGPPKSCPCLCWRMCHYRSSPNFLLAGGSTNRITAVQFRPGERPLLGFLFYLRQWCMLFGGSVGMYSPLHASPFSQLIHLSLGSRGKFCVLVICNTYINLVHTQGVDTTLPNRIFRLSAAIGDKDCDTPDLFDAANKYLALWRTRDTIYKFSNFDSNVAY